MEVIPALESRIRPLNSHCSEIVLKEIAIVVLFKEIQCA